ncbi:2-dehydro-3-deoxygalactonokinase [Palleronia sp. LCG004]|uniref:2-dehydro-3-deoxygalactonokinase n=1 Tax=Palleronia sp. LCG004 TaxID=3079304 RepID=UPI002941BE18|nr:2-dehydro-3-deoxygalactonokinase [Palleronia sp. LCG004]WOI55523.1 2-dehydro-3-deoxygalactonokinase [Palleronia sp. LCG004]
MTVEPDWIAVDWGTSHARAWAMSGEAVLAEGAPGPGMGTLSPDGFAPALARMIDGWRITPEIPVVACGMVGAKQGWHDAGYRTVPATPLPDRLARVPADIALHIVPGLSQTAPADVMRGEETQIAGFLALNPDFDGAICLPGSHSKWVQISAGEVVSFRTMMTGELFAALSRETILRHSVGEGWDDAAFAEAVSETLSRPEALAARLFSIRAEGLLAGLSPGAAQARLSGLLIGAELAAAKPYWLGMPVALIGAATLAGRYATALEMQGLQVVRTRGEALTLRGLTAALGSTKGNTA